MAPFPRVRSNVYMILNHAGLTLLGLSVIFPVKLPFVHKIVPPLTVVIILVSSHFSPLNSVGLSGRAICQ